MRRRYAAVARRRHSRSPTSGTKLPLRLRPGLAPARVTARFDPVIHAAPERDIDWAQCGVRMGRPARSRRPLSPVAAPYIAPNTASRVRARGSGGTTPYPAQCWHFSIRDKKLVAARVEGAWSTPGESMHSYDQRMGVRDGKLTAERTAPSLIVGTSIMVLCAVAAVLLIWSVAVPTGPEVCVLTYPGPRNCFVSDRLAAATVSTVVLGLTFAVALIASVTLFRRWSWAVGAGVALVLLAGPVAFVAVAWIPAWA